MQITLGFVRSPSQTLLKSMDWELTKVETRLIDNTDLPDHSLQGLIFADTAAMETLMGTLEKERRHYPILEATTYGVNYEGFEAMPGAGFKELSEKIQSRWQNHHNLSAVEDLSRFTIHLKTLWNKDRLGFFEEFWYWAKTNLAATQLDLIFNDLAEDGQKLTQSLLSGSKKANFVQGGGKERALMETYLEKWNDTFEVTEWDSAKGRFVATVVVEKSPIILMAQTNTVTPLTRALFKGLFNGLTVTE